MCVCIVLIVLFLYHCITNCSCKVATKKVVTGSEDAIAAGLVPNTFMWTGMLVACGKHSHRVPLSTLDVLERVVMREVVTVRKYVVVGTRTGQATAELSDCNRNTQNSLSLNYST